MDRKLVLLAALLAVSLVGYFYLSSKPQVRPEITLETAGSGPGWINITLLSNVPLQSAELSLARDAKLLGCSGDTCRFRYWIKPGEPGGNYTARILLNTSLGQFNIEKKVPITVNNNWQELDGIIFYGENVSKVIQEFNTSEINVYAYFEPGQSKINARVIDSEVMIIAGLTALNKTVHYYAITTDLSQCIYTLPGTNKTENLTVANCISQRSNRPSIVIELPTYPSDQVLVKEDQLVIQGSEQGLRDLTKKLVLFLAKYIKH